MKIFSTLFLLFSVTILLTAQESLPQDYLSSEFHKSRREALRDKMSTNTVAVFFANPVRNRANDVEYVYHQDPNFYYLTGYKEPHAVLVIFSEMQTNSENKTYNEILYDYRIVYTFFVHLQETEAITTLSKTESKYLLLNL